LESLKRLFVTIDKVIEGCAITLLVSMIVIVFMQVITRKIFNFVFFWSEEITLLSLTWFCFMGIAIGFREKLHLAMDMIESFSPKIIITILDRIIDICVFGFGVYLTVKGWEFVQLMSESILPATGMPNSIQYYVVPLTGVLCCVYSLLQLLGFDLRRYHKIEEEIQKHHV
jgi:TRAP-type C4-dicarboxylate transport system permease small subunit